MSTNPITIPISELNPTVLLIGELIGLLEEQSAEQVVLNTKWFDPDQQNGGPLHYIKDIPSNPKLIELLTTLMGSASGTALGTPKKELDKTWYPFLNPATSSSGGKQEAVPLGVYLVTAENQNGDGTVLGIGFLHDFKPAESVTISPFGFFPLLVLPATEGDTTTFVLGQEGHPVELGIYIDAKGIFNAGEGGSSISFDGLNIGADIYFEANKLPSPNLEFINLKLPGETKGSNRSLLDLINNVQVQEWITICFSVLATQLSNLNQGDHTAANIINSFLELLGLIGDTPALDWSELEKEPATEFIQWFRKIGGSAENLKHWMYDWYCLFNGVDPISTSASEDAVQGSGTSDAPFRIKIQEIKVSDTLSLDLYFSLWTSVDKSGNLNLFPGLMLTSTPFVPVEEQPLGIQVIAELDLLEFELSPSNTATIEFFPSFDVKLSAVNITAGKPLIAATIADVPFSLGEIHLGFQYENADSAIPMPFFQLVNVQSGDQGSWPVIDMSNLSVQTVVEAIEPIIKAKLEEMFPSDSKNQIVPNLSAVLALMSPPAFAGGAWPLEDDLLLGSSGLKLLVNDPLSALGAYYTRCLKTQADGKVAWAYMMPAFVQTLGGSGTNLTGTGTTTDPWQVEILSIGDAVAYLQTWDTSGKQETLAIGFSFSVPITIAEVEATVGIRTSLLSLELPAEDGTGSYDASWFQFVCASLKLTGENGGAIAPPALAGLSLKIQDFLFETGWNATAHFYASAALEKVQLSATGLSTIDLGTIELSSSAWDKSQLQKFAPAILNSLGLLLMEHGGKIGVGLTGLLGLIPSLDQLFDGQQQQSDYSFPIPEGLKLPSSWPEFKLDNLSNPWIDVKNQIAALLAGKGTTMEPAMQLLGWSFTGTLPKVPAITPAGDLTDPWSVMLTDIWDVEVLSWLGANNQIGFGLRRSYNKTADENVELNLQLRLDIPGFVVPTNILSEAEESEPVLPSFWIMASCTNPTSGQPLLPQNSSGIEIGSMQMGARASIDGGDFEYGMTFAFLQSKFSANAQLQTIALSKDPNSPKYTCTNGMQVIEGLTNTFMDKLTATINAAAGKFPQLQACLDILSLLEIVDKGSSSPVTYGINLGAWDGLLANPGTYFVNKATAVLEDGQKNSDFLQDLATLLGYPNFNLPSSAQGVQYLLAGLGLLKPYPNDLFGIVIENWVKLTKDPIAFFQISIPALFNNPDALKQLISELKTITNPSTDIFSVDNTGYIVTVQTPVEKPIQLGSEVLLFGSLVINLKTLSMTFQLGSGVYLLNSAIAFQFTPSYSNGTLSADYAFVLEGLPGVEPVAFPPLDLYPFPQDSSAYLQQIGWQALVSLLSTFAVNVLNSFVVPSHPTVLKIFGVLGLTVEEEKAQKEKIKPLAGIFQNPIAWMLSPPVLGDGSGGLDLTKFGQLLYALTDAAGIGSQVKLAPYDDSGKKDGVQLTGLPYGVAFYFTSNDTSGATLKAAFAPAFSSPAPAITMEAGLSFGLSKGVNLLGNSSLQFNLGPVGSEEDTFIKLEAQYEKEAFSLIIQGQYEKQAFTPIKLVPFGGLNQFIPGSGTVQALLEFAGDKLFGALQNYINDHGTDTLVQLIQAIQKISNINSGKDLLDFFSNIKQDPLAPFKSGQIKNTISGINDLVTNILKLDGFSIASSGTLLEYKHSLPGDSANEIVVFVGNQSFEGQNEVFGLWVQPAVKFKWLVCGLANSGVGVSLDGKDDLVYSVEIDLGLDLSSEPIAGLPSPIMALAFSGTGTSFTGPIMQVYPISKSTDKGTLLIDLIPTPALEIVGQGTVSVGEWLEQLAVKFLVPFAANLALSTKEVEDFLDQQHIGSTDVTPGAVLTKWGLISKTDGTYSLADLSSFYKDNGEAKGVVTKLIFSAFSLLNGKTIFSLTNPKGKIAVAADDTEKLYGLTVQLQDIVVTSGNGGKSPKLSFQLGKWFADQKAGQNWINNTEEEPGLTFYFIQETGDNTFDFHPRLDLTSVGLDFEGANEKTPLVDVKGASIQAIEPRAYLSMDFNGGSPKIAYGVAMYLQQIGFPVGPGFDNSSGSKTNPVAQNLLASGENSSGKTAAINPAFSFSTSYVSNAASDPFNFQFYNSDGSPTEQIWIPIQRAFGPLQARKIGFGWIKADYLLELLFDGKVSLAGLAVDLQELEIGVPVKTPTAFDDYVLDLAGIDVSFQGGPVTISGGFLKLGSGQDVQYVGAALLKALQFSLGAFGAYGTVTDDQGNKAPSLFIFAYLDTPLGGPPAFFLTGLSGGFGYNRSVKLPANTADIATYPMIAGISNPATLGGQNGNAPSGTQVLEKLGNEWFKPTRGVYWVAAGIKFTSFELVHSNAVVIIQFGNQFEIDLIGTSAIELPKSGLSYLNAELAFKVVFNPDVGIFMAEAVLTENSWVIVPECKLTGGFAFYVWFKNQSSGASAGEFVVTLGGYYSGWTPPSYYPTVPRVGFNWHFSDVINITGGLYFAMTPSAVMAGGNLNAVYETGPVKAWFNAFADFFMSWKPFHYNIRIGVDIGAKAWIFKVELGCDLELWGPQMAGKARVSWYVISFTITFGDQSTSKDQTQLIGWGDFTEAFLPQPQAPAPPPSSEVSSSDGPKPALKDAPVAVQQVTKTIVGAGLLKEETDDAGVKTWLVRADQFAFDVQSAAPLNAITFTSSDGHPKDPLLGTTDFGVKPVGSVVFSSKNYNANPDQMDKISYLDISLLYYGSPSDVDDWSWDNTLADGNVPASMWDTVNNGKAEAGSNMIKGVVVGLQSVTPTVKEPYGGLPTLEMSVLGYSPIARRGLPLYSRPQLTDTGTVAQDDQSLSLIESTVMSADVVDYRAEVIDSLVALGISLAYDGNLDQMAAFATTTFQAPPLVGKLGAIGEIASTASPGLTLTPNPAKRIPSHHEDTDFQDQAKKAVVRARIHQIATPLKTHKSHLSFGLPQGIPLALSDGTVFRSKYPGGKYALAGTGEASSDLEKGTNLSLTPGQSLILSLPDTAKKSRLKIKALKTALRVVAFDRHQQLILDEALSSARASLTLPNEASRLVLSARLPEQDVKFNASGWHRHSSLILANANALIGEGVVIIPDHPCRISNRQFNVEEGLVRAGHMITRNKRRIGDGEPVRAGIKTVFPDKLATIAVLVSSELPIDCDDSLIAASIRLRIPISNPKRTAWDYQVQKAHSVIGEGSNRVLLYRVPKFIYGDRLEVVVDSSGDWYQTGLLGFKEHSKKVLENWEDLSLMNSLPDNFEHMDSVTSFSLQF